MQSLICWDMTTTSNPVLEALHYEWLGGMWLVEDQSNGECFTELMPLLGLPQPRCSCQVFSPFFKERYQGVCNGTKASDEALVDVQESEKLLQIDSFQNGPLSYSRYLGLIYDNPFWADDMSQEGNLAHMNLLFFPLTKNVWFCNSHSRTCWTLCMFVFKDGEKIKMSSMYVMRDLLVSLRSPLIRPCKTERVQESPYSMMLYSQ